MNLLGDAFPPVFNAAGAQGFCGEGYPYHRFWKFAGLTYRNCGFVAKTTTLSSNKGNMPLKEDGMTPVEFVPSCIVVRPLEGVVLNAVGLSGPGAHVLLETGRWQQRDEPFFLSFMSIRKTKDERLAESKDFVRLLQRYLPHFRSPVGLEMNSACPNTGMDPSALIEEIGEALDIAAALRIPLQVKLNVLSPVAAISQVARHPACSAVTMSNTVPWGKLPDRIPWRQLFGSSVSPLRKFGGGGLSGWPLFPLVCEWIEAARDHGLAKPIWACGGINSVSAIRRVKRVGASGVQLGTVGMLKPHLMRGLIRYAHEVF